MSWAQGVGSGDRFMGRLLARGKRLGRRYAGIVRQAGQVGLASRDSACWVPVGPAGRVLAVTDRWSVGQDKADIAV